MTKYLIIMQHQCILSKANQLHEKNNLKTNNFKGCTYLIHNQLCNLRHVKLMKIHKHVPYLENELFYNLGLSWTMGG